MALPECEWLHIAQRLAVGQTTRVYHGRESRPNLVIGHDSSHYWAYCQACREGGKMIKSHVLVTGATAPATSTSLSLPSDRVMLSKADPFVQDALALLLAKKNMDAMYLPPVWYSAERKRLLIKTPQGWLGRDTTGASNQKWLTYDAQNYLAAGDLADRHVILVEDAFSWYKVQFALRATSLPLSAACLLGTDVRPTLAVQLLKARSAHAFLDGDSAGKSGAARAVRLLRGLNLRCLTKLPPDGLDPKDMQLREIRELCEGVFNDIVAGS